MARILSAEMNWQIVYDSLHARERWTEPYLIELVGETTGYGSIVVGGRGQGRGPSF